jgi:uncharacterized membrane protein YccF (DUF307 family)
MREQADGTARQVLVERGPGTRRWVIGCLLVSLVGLAVLVVCGLSATRSPWDVVGLVLFVPFGAMAINGAIYRRRRH